MAYEFRYRVFDPTIACGGVQSYIMGAAEEVNLRTTDSHILLQRLQRRTLMKGVHKEAPQCRNSVFTATHL